MNVKKQSILPASSLAGEFMSYRNISNTQMIFLHYS